MAAYGKQLGGPLDDAAIERLVAFIRARQGTRGDAAPPRSRRRCDGAASATVRHECAEAATAIARRAARHVHLANVAFLAQASDPFLRYAIVNGRPGHADGRVRRQALGRSRSPTSSRTSARSRTPRNRPVGQLPPPTGKEPLVINPKGKEPELEACARTAFVPVDEVKKAYDEKRKMIIIDARPAVGLDARPHHRRGLDPVSRHEAARRDPEGRRGSIAYCACPHHLSGDRRRRAAQARPHASRSCSTRASTSGTAAATRSSRRRASRSRRPSPSRPRARSVDSLGAIYRIR